MEGKTVGEGQRGRGEGGEKEWGGGNHTSATSD